MKNETTLGKSVVCRNEVSTKEWKKSWGDAFIFIWQPTDLHSLQPNLPFPSGFSKPGDLFRAGHLNSMCFPSKKTLTVPPSPVQIFLSTWKQSPKSSCCDICVVATEGRERALGNTVPCSCGSHRAMQTLAMIRAVVHALNTAFVHVSYLDLTEWGRKKKDHTVL